MITFKIDEEKSKKLENSFSKISKNIEGELNKYLHSKGSKEVIDSIIGFIPVSDRKKKHAKYSNSLKRNSINLGFNILAKSKFRYLFFPNEGVGKNNKVAQRFFQKGLKNKEEKLFNDLMKIIEENSKIS